MESMIVAIAFPTVPRNNNASVYVGIDGNCNALSAGGTCDYTGETCPFGSPRKIRRIQRDLRSRKEESPSYTGTTNGNTCTLVLVNSKSRYGPVESANKVLHDSHLSILQKIGGKAIV